MKLISCHVENFGKLHNYAVDFTEGKNVILAENGFGKSTLAGFIRAMFYGLDGQGRQGIEKNERKRYEPWQGGVFGGKLIFELNGKQYEVIRTFGTKEEFELRDAKTNLISHDYTSDLGKELFQVNRESFIRTIFIGQNDCQAGVTDDIHAKIGDLADNANDLNNYEKADENLKSLLNSMTPKRATGTLTKRSKEIAELERRVSEGGRIEESISLYRDKLQEEQQVYEKIKEDVKETSEQQARVSKLQGDIEKKKQWDELQDTYQIRKDKEQELRKEFGDEVPKIHEIENMIQTAGELSRLRERWLKEKMTVEEEEQYETLAKVYAKDSEDATSMAELWNERNSKKSSLSAKQTALMLMKTNQSTTKKKNSVLFPIGIVLIVIGIVLAIASILIGAIVVGAGVVLAVMGLNANKKEASLVNQEQQQEIDKMQTEIQSDERFIQKAEAEMVAYLQAHGKTYNEYTVVSELSRISTDYAKYCDLKKKARLAENSDVKSEMSSLVQKISSFLKKFEVFSQEQQFTDDLYTLKSKVEKYESQKALFFEVKEKIEAFRENVDEYVLTMELPKEDVESLNDLNDKLTMLNEKREESFRAIKNYQDNMEMLREQYESWEEMKLRLEEMKTTQEEELKKYRHIEEAKHFLGVAKESMTSKYVGPILSKFKQYFEMITGYAAERYRMDANTNLTVEECGKQREVVTLSTGYQDLVGICLRVALVDAMYTEERPFLIMDDPFVNLDDEKMHAAQKFLDSVANEYQILYFTCSNMRV